MAETTSPTEGLTPVQQRAVRWAERHGYTELSQQAAVFKWRDALRAFRRLSRDEMEMLLQHDQEVHGDDDPELERLIQEAWPAKPPAPPAPPSAPPPPEAPVVVQTALLPRPPGVEPPPEPQPPREPPDPRELGFPEDWRDNATWQFENAERIQAYALVMQRYREAKVAFDRRLELHQARESTHRDQTIHSQFMADHMREIEKAKRLGETS
jgi:hypothetical protein